MANVSTVTNESTQAAIKKASEKAANNSNIGKEDFLKILVSQLKNQDPLNPSNDTEFISQMTQLSTLEQMQTLNKNFENSQTFSLMGKYVSAIAVDNDTGEFIPVEGTVESVAMLDGSAVLKVGDYYVASEDVYQVQAKAPETATVENGANETDQTGTEAGL